MMRGNFEVRMVCMNFCTLGRTRTVNELERTEKDKAAETFLRSLVGRLGLGFASSAIIYLHR